MSASLEIGDRSLSWFAFAFAITQLVEIPIYVRALRPRSTSAPREDAGIQKVRSDVGAHLAPRGRSWRSRAGIAFGASALTHPFVWFVFPSLTEALLATLARVGLSLDSTARTLVYGVLAEGFAVLAEAGYLRTFGVRRALAWSLAANTSSVLIGTFAVHALA